MATCPPDKTVTAFEHPSSRDASIDRTSHNALNDELSKSKETVEAPEDADADIEKGGSLELPTNAPVEPDARRSDLVEFDGPDDPGNPKNWSKGKKWVVTMSMASLVFTVTMSSSIFSVAIGVVAEEFDVSTEVSTLGVALFVLVRAPLALSLNYLTASGLRIRTHRFRPHVRSLRPPYPPLLRLHYLRNLPDTRRRGAKHTNNTGWTVHVGLLRCCTPLRCRRGSGGHVGPHRTCLRHLRIRSGRLCWTSCWTSDRRFHYRVIPGMALDCVDNAHYGRPDGHNCGYRDTRDVCAADPTDSCEEAAIRDAELGAACEGGRTTNHDKPSSDCISGSPVQDVRPGTHSGAHYSLYELHLRHLISAFRSCKPCVPPNIRCASADHAY